MVYRHPALKKYIRKIKHFLPCSGDEKQYLIAQLQESILDYLEQNPTADFKTLQSQFGTPREIANQYLCDQETAVLLRKINCKKQFLAILSGTVAAILVLWISIIAFDVLAVRKANRGYLEVVITQSDHFVK